ncbi:hypothetical protein [Enterococcus rivorum]|uniref:DUF5105 domain-containing protein n=1 Tax=Enterococcus rivorum TaxID=762845 RepID=A0A1E5KSK7_9ENTE|nr:hypothetical protein [Enterococcus rivorum]MBP2097409.1 hypothetical protein [Enterococcus rivorum]OEH80758.1 hypothetical protein BCR26_07065 [Enterococcus rivorum]
MRRKNIVLSVFVFCFLLMISACGQVNRYKKFSKDDQNLSWSGKRKRSFGDSDYSNLKNEKEALALLQDKYQLVLPEYYEATKKMLGKELTSDTVKEGTAKYSLFTRNKELKFHTIYPYYKGEELQAFSEVIITYAYLIDKEQAYVKSQVVTVKISQINGKLPNDNLNELIKAVGTNMKLTDKQITSGLAGYDLKIKESKTPITDDYLPIVSNSSGLYKDQELLKEIAAVYDQSGNFRELYAEVSDQID